MEIILLNPYHDEHTLLMGLTYFILFVKKDENKERASPNIKIAQNFFDNSTLNKNEKKPFEKQQILSGMSNFKKERCLT